MSQVVSREGDSLLYMALDDGRWFWYDTNSAPLGEGAMGRVYLGYNLYTQEPVAIKRVRDEYASIPDIRRRAINEAHLVFSHPNIVRMLGVCTESVNYGPIFILSEFIPGQTIDVYTKNNLSYCSPEERISKILSLAVPLLEAIQLLHDNGVIHRDIKPSNIMVEENGECKLMDLGIAKTIYGGNFSKTIGFIGTMQYAAPELIVGTNQVSSADYRVDIYALGVTLYELISGFNPFDAPTQAETMIKQAKEDLPAVNTIPRNLLEILRKATAKDRARRFQSASQFKDALLDFMAAGSKQATTKKPMIIAFTVMGVLSVIWVILLTVFLNSVIFQ